MKAFTAIALILLFIGKCDDPAEDAVPPCILQKIENIKMEDAWEPPATVWRITTLGQGTLYYLPEHCCDFYSELYDDHCNLLCNPEGGIGGNGYGDCPPFREIKRELIWKDDR